MQMSVFCPKCGKRTYDEYSCDHCQYEIKPKSYTKKVPLNINNNKIITVSIVIIAIAVSFLAINKLTEDTPEESALKAMYGTTDQKEIKKINDDIVKQGEKAMMEAGKKQINMFENMLHNK